MNEPSRGQISTSGANTRKRVNPSSFPHAPRKQGAGALRNVRRLGEAAPRRLKLTQAIISTTYA